MDGADIDWSVLDWEDMRILPDRRTSDLQLPFSLSFDPFKCSLFLSSCQRNLIAGYAHTHITQNDYWLREGAENKWRNYLKNNNKNFPNDYKYKFQILFEKITLATNWMYKIKQLIVYISTNELSRHQHKQKNMGITSSDSGIFSNIGSNNQQIFPCLSIDMSQRYRTEAVCLPFAMAQCYCQQWWW
jgi:hypothetical protein